MSKQKATKITFYADPDIKRELAKLEGSIKSHTINKLLRSGFKRGISVEERLLNLEARLQLVETALDFDGFAINAIREVLLDHSGGKMLDDLGKKYIDLQVSGEKPKRTHWETDW